MGILTDNDELEQKLEETQKELDELKVEVDILNCAVLLLKNRLVENKIDISDLMPKPWKDGKHMSREQLIEANKEAASRVVKAKSTDSVPMPSEEEKSRIIIDNQKK